MFSGAYIPVQQKPGVFHHFDGKFSAYLRHLELAFNRPSVSAFKGAAAICIRHRPCARHFGQVSPDALLWRSALFFRVQFGGPWHSHRRFSRRSSMSSHICRGCGTWNREIKGRSWLVPFHSRAGQINPVGSGRPYQVKYIQYPGIPPCKLA